MTDQLSTDLILTDLRMSLDNARRALVELKVTHGKRMTPAEVEAITHVLTLLGTLYPLIERLALKVVLRPMPNGDQ